MKPHAINQLAVWMPMKGDDLLIKAFPTGYPYMQGGIIVRSNLAKPVTRYAKNYMHSEKRYSLCMISTEQDSTKIEAWMDYQASHNIKVEDMDSKFKLLDLFYKV